MGSMNRPAQPRWPVVVCWLLAIAGAGAIALSFWSGGRRLGDLPLALSPTGFWIVVATVSWGLALAILWARAGGRLDSRIANKTSAELVIGALTNSRVLQQLRTALPGSPAHLPTRVSLAVTGAGIEIWGGPGLTHYVTLPWSDIRRVEQSQVVGMTRVFTALRFILEGEGRLLDIPVTGSSVSGTRSPSAAEVQSWATDITRLGVVAGLRPSSQG